MQNLRSVLIVSAILAGIGCVTSLTRPSIQVLLIDLPGWEEPIPRNGKPIHAVVEVTEEGAVSLNGTIVDVEILPESLLALGMRYPMVLFHAEDGVTYATLTKVLNAIAEAGVPRSKVCFDDIDRFRRVESSPFPSKRKAPEPHDEGGLVDLEEIPEGNCQSLTMPPPLY